MKRQILDSALEFVPEHGWTDLALQKGAEAQGLSSAIEGLFPRGPGDLVLHFIEECNGKLAEQLLEESKINNELPGAPDIPYDCFHFLLLDLYTGVLWPGGREAIPPIFQNHQIFGILILCGKIYGLLLFIKIKIFNFIRKSLN